MIRVVIADDIRILRQGLKVILEQDPGLCVAGLAANGKEAWELCRDQKPDVVLMDMRMPEYDGSYGLRRIKQDFPQIRALVLTTFDDPETVGKAVESGADGYVLKEMEDAELIRSVKAVCAGLSVFGGGVFEGLRRQMSAGAAPSAQPDRGVCGGKAPAGETSAHAASEPAVPLTPREQDIVRLIVQGLENREIAATLYLAEGTVRNNISRILEKLGLKDRTQLAVYAVKHHLA